jgi:hypothetical protein
MLDGEGAGVWSWAPPEGGHRAAAIPAAAAAAGAERRRDRVRRLQMYPPPPEGPPVTTLVQMSAHVFVPSASDAREAAQVLLMDATAGTGGAGADAGADNAPPANGLVFNMADGDVNGAPALVMGAYRGYNGGGLTGQLFGWSNCFPATSQLHEADLVAADNGQPAAGVGDAASLLGNNAFTDGTAAFQLWLYQSRFAVPEPWRLTPGQIAAIVLCLLLTAWFVRFVYYDYTYRVFFFDKPLVEAPPAAEPAFDPTLKTIEQALAMHETTSAVVPEEAPVPLASRVRNLDASYSADGSVAFSRESETDREAVIKAQLEAEQAARLAEALAAEEEAKRKKRGTSWFGRSNRIEVAPIEKPDPTAVQAAREREAERKRAQEAAQAAADAMEELMA